MRLPRYGIVASPNELKLKNRFVGPEVDGNGDRRLPGERQSVIFYSRTGVGNSVMSESERN